MIKEFKEMLKNEGRTLKWFIQNYLPDARYNTVISQVNEFNPLSEETTEAIKKFMRGE